MLAPYSQHKITVWLADNGYAIQPIRQEYYEEYYGDDNNYDENDNGPFYVLHYPNKTTSIELTVHQIRLLTSEIYKIRSKQL